MASPLYTNASLNQPEEWGQTPDPTTAAASTSKPYDGVSTPSDPNFDWNHYDAYLKAHADDTPEARLAAAKQTLSDTAPTQQGLDAAAASAQPKPAAPADHLGTFFGLKPNTDVTSALSDVHDVGSGEAANMGLGLGDAVPAVLGKAGQVAANIGGRAAAGYGGYQAGSATGIPGAGVAGAVVGALSPNILAKIAPSGKLGALLKFFGVSAEDAAPALAAGERGSQEWLSTPPLDRPTPTMTGENPPGWTGPYSSESHQPFGPHTGPTAPPDEMFRREPGDAYASGDNISTPGAKAYTESEYAKNSGFPTDPMGRPDPAQLLDYFRSRAAAPSVRALEAPTAPPSAGGSTGTYPAGNTEEGAFNPDLGSVPNSAAARQTATSTPPSAPGFLTGAYPGATGGSVPSSAALRARLASATEGVAPTKPGRVLWGPGATTKAGTPAQAMAGPGNLLYDPQTPTSYIQAQYGLTKDPAEKEFLARVLRQRSNIPGHTVSPYPPRSQAGSQP